MIEALGKIFLWQIFLVGVIGFVLFKVLNRTLIESAIWDFEFYKPDPEIVIKNVTVITHRPLHADAKEKIKNVLRKKYPQSQCVYTEDPKIRGGMIIKIDNKVIDCSVVGRLRRSGIWR